MSCSTVFREKGLRLTPQRRLILDVIHDTRGHLTADDIISYVQSRAPGVNKSTVYRTLDILEETGCVYKSEAEGVHIYHHAEAGHHHHLACEACGATFDCEEDIFEPVAKKMREEYGFQANFQHMVVRGLCRKCQAKNR